jgi:meso-butanediol dehydrogenase/(S,S)-butanediol dehydrogenase/diacetyl reductase
MARFTNKVVIVTGAGSGIGKATARHFLTEGASVVFNDIHKDLLETAAQGFDPGKVLLHDGDVSDADYIQRLIDDTVARFGAIDVLVNNAGIELLGPIMRISNEDFNRVIAVNLNSVFYATRAAFPHLLKSKGSVINVSGTSGLGGDTFASPYNASKGGVSNLTRSLALELGSQGVRVNAVNPVLIADTEMSQYALGNARIKERFMDRIPLSRSGELREVTDAIAFLASEEASYINGVNLPIDGGMGASSGTPNGASASALAELGFS